MLLRLMAHGNGRRRQTGMNGLMPSGKPFFWCEGSTFESATRGDGGGVPTTSIKRVAKRHFCVRAASRHSMSRSCPAYQKIDLILTTADGQLRRNQKRLDYRSCTLCDLGSAGEGDERRVLQKDHVACANIHTGGIAEMQTKKTPHDLQKCSL